jgi:hypothetical protein
LFILFEAKPLQSSAFYAGDRKESNVRGLSGGDE